MTADAGRMSEAREFVSTGFLGMLGTQLVSAGNGSCTLRVEVNASHVQHFGQTHGGFVTTILDGAAACACFVDLAPGTPFTSTDFSVQFLRTVPLGPGLAEATILHRGSRRLVVKASFRDAAGKLCAEYLGGFIQTSPRGSSPGTAPEPSPG